MVLAVIGQVYATLRKDVTMIKNVFSPAYEKHSVRSSQEQGYEKESWEHVEDVVPDQVSDAQAVMQIVFVPTKSSAGQYTGAIVKSHVAKLAAAKRRAQKDKEKRESPSKTPPPLTSRTRLRRHESSSSSSSNDRIDQNITGEQVDTRRLPSLGSPSSALTSNADPFRSTIVVLDASTNDLLAFHQDYFLPLVNSFERSQHKHAAFLNKFYQTCLEAMHDECTANASLARLAAVVAAHVPEDSGRQRLVASYTGRAYRSLRGQIALAMPDGRDRLKAQIFALFSAETLAHNFGAAAVHIRTLQNLLEQDKAEGRQIDLVLLQACSWKDIIRSMLSCTRPIFRLEAFVDLSYDVLNALDLKLTQLGLLQEGLLTESIEIPAALRPHLTKFRWLSHICGACPRAPRLATVEVNCSFANHATVTMSKVNSIYFDAVEAISQHGSSHEDDEEGAERQITAAAALAGAFWIWADSGFDFLDSGNAGWKVMFSSLSPAPRVLPELLQRISSNDRSGYPASPTMRLWLLYVASLAEQAVSNFADGGLAAWRTDCYLGFVAQAMDMSISAWEDVELSLGKFLYHPRTRPNDAEWFEQASAFLRLREP